MRNRKACVNMDCGLVLMRRKDLSLERCPICGDSLRDDKALPDWRNKDAARKK